VEYTIEFSAEFEKSAKKLAKKNRPLLEQIKRKLAEVIRQPEHYKPLGNELAGYRRLHFGSFVLTYAIRGSVVRVIAIDHHDHAY
jgi:YafQ family addiction module toxin component